MDILLIICMLCSQIASNSAIYALLKFKIIATSVQNTTVLCYAFSLLAPLFTYILFRRGYRHVDPLMYVFSFLSLASLGSLELALEFHGLIPKVITPLAVTYMPLLKSAHGLVFLYWDGVANYALAITCIALYTSRRSHREVGLFWGGSVVNGLCVLLTACLTGKEEVNPCLLFDALLTGVPLLALINMIHNRTIQARCFLKFPPIWKRPCDLFFFIYFAFAMHVSCIRFLAVNGTNIPVIKDYVKTYEPYLADASVAPKFQVQIYDYIYGVYYLFAMYGLWVPGQHWMADFALVTAGGAAQAQFTYIAGALNSRTPASLRPAMEGKAAILFWSINILLALVPQLFVLHTQKDFEKFGRTQTVDYASPIRRKVYVVKETKETTTTTKKLE